MTNTRSSPFDLKQLRYFVAVAEELHFGKAARRLGISQPPLSEQVLALEASLGTRLFFRTKRSVALTPTGHALYEEAIQLIAHAARVRELMNSARSGGRGPLYIGCVPSGLFGVLPAILRKWTDSPDTSEVQIKEAHTADIVKSVLDCRLDAGFVWENRAPATLTIRVLEYARIAVALHEKSPLSRKETVSLSDLAELPLILAERSISPHLFDLIHTSFGQAGLEPRIGQHAGSILAQLSFVASRLGYALVPEYLTRLPVAEVKFSHLVEDIKHAPLSLIWNDKRVSPQLAAFKSLVFDEYPVIVGAHDLPPTQHRGTKSYGRP